GILIATDDHQVSCHSLSSRSSIDPQGLLTEGTCAEASVVIGYTDDRLEIEVVDTGGAQDRPPVDGNGRGLIGLRERLAVYGGDLTAGPTLAGGYRIKARVPWRTA
ncbi:hypothetical protein ABZS63_42850, partial [Streptomyces sp. NPDC005568]